MTRWHRSTRLFVLLLIGSLATSAAAQPALAPKKQPTQQELDQARAHFKTAEAAKARGDYKAAVAEYLAAYELFADPEFFFDIGEVYRLADDEPDSLTYYQKYLQLDPNGRGATTARTAIGKLQRSIAAKQDAAKHAADAETRRKADQDAKHAADAEIKADEGAKRNADQDVARRAADAEAKREQPAPPPDMPPAAPATRIWYRDPITVGLLGAGVAATGVGTGFLLSARSLHQDAFNAKTLPQLRDLTTRASQRATLGLITGSVGVVLGGSGIAWIFLHRDSSEQRTITGWLKPGGGGLAITGPF